MEQLLYTINFEKKTKEELLKLAYIDPLTNAYNRNILNELSLTWNLCAGLVVMIDIDGLKEVNDTFGHSAGDKIIAHVAEKLINLPDVAVVRMGGDEFLLVSSKDTTLVLDIPGISYGYVKKRAHQTLSDAIEEADKQMYKNKLKRRKSHV